MDARLFCAPVDLVDDVPGSIAQIQELVGGRDAAGVLLAAAYHAARDVLPRNRRRVHFSPAGLAFAPDLARFPAALPPPAHLPVCAGRDVLAETVESARAGGVRSDAWVVYLHHDVSAPGATAGRVVNAFGDVNPIALCPSAPETVQYASALTAQVCERGPDGVLSEALHHQTFAHGYHHERSFVGLGGLARTLLALCLCPHCECAARARGLDVDALRGWIRETVDGPQSADPLPGRAGLCSLADPHAGTGTLEEFMGMRTAGIATLHRTCAQLAAAAGVEFVTMDPSEILAETHTADGTVDGAWQSGIDAAAIGAAAIAPTFYVSSAAQARAQLDRVTTRLGRAPAGAIVRLVGDDLDQGADLGATVSMLAAEGVGWIGYYHYGLAPTDRLRSVGPIHAGASAARGRRAAGP